jgi:hypothetical protein
MKDRDESIRYARTMAPEHNSNYKNWEEEGIYLPGQIRQNDGA